MERKELFTQLYIMGITIAAVWSAALAAIVWPIRSNMPELWLLALVVGLIVLAGRLSIMLSRQAEASLFTIPLFMTVLVMHPTLAALAAALGTLTFQIMLRRPGRAIAFNVSMAAMAGALGGIVYMSLRPEGVALAVTQEHMIAAGMAGLVLHLHNILPVVGMITLRKGRVFWASWGESYTLEAAVEGILLSLGLLSAIVAVQASWGLALMALPAVAAYQVLKHTVEFAAKKGMVAEELESRLATELDGWDRLKRNASRQSAGAIPELATQHATSLRSVLR